MRMFLIGAAVLCSCVSTSQADSILVANDGFEVPNLGSGGDAYFYGPSGASWAFAGGSGIAANGSAFNVSGAPNGNSAAAGGATSSAGQAGFLQNTGAFSQTVNLPFHGIVRIEFIAEGRLGQDGANAIQLLWDNVPIGAPVTPTTGTFSSFFDVFTELTPGNHTLGFAGTFNTGDHTTFVDNVSANVVPEPGSLLVMLGIGAVGLILSRNRYLFSYRRVGFNEASSRSLSKN